MITNDKEQMLMTLMLKSHVFIIHVGVVSLVDRISRISILTEVSRNSDAAKVLFT